MKRVTKILIGGLVLAVGIVGWGLWNQHRLESRLSALVAECDKGRAAAPSKGHFVPDAAPAQAAPESKKAANPFDQFDRFPDAPPASNTTFDLSTARPVYESDPLVCEPATLAMLGETAGLQKVIVGVYWESRRALSETWPIALLVAALFAVPWFWYFLLRRIVELRNAVGGKLPD